VEEIGEKVSQNRNRLPQVARTQPPDNDPRVRRGRARKKRPSKTGYTVSLVQSALGKNQV